MLMYVMVSFIKRPGAEEEQVEAMLGHSFRQYSYETLRKLDDIIDMIRHGILLTFDSTLGIVE
jgi:hypothetical protein